MATILLAEDNEAVRLLTQAKLRHQFTVVTAANGRETLDILNRQHVDLIVADVMMPVMDGYQLVRTLRAEGNEIPVLFLTALQSMDSKREGFSSGIDDYLTKPVDYEELIWRIQALLRRAHIASEQQILVGNTRLDSASYTVTCRGQTLELPKKEFDLLYKLLSYPGQIFTRSSCWTMCGGIARPGRNYYTEFVKQTPADTVVLTLACGKYRFNDLDLGTIGGLPRLMDVGQCNDAYGAVKIALALAEAFGCGVNDLPLSLVLSWYEQKAVCILLTLLHLGIKNIRLGPTLPAFISPNVLNYLVENFGIAPITTQEEDLKQLLK